MERALADAPFQGRGNKALLPFIENLAVFL